MLNNESIRTSVLRLKDVIPSRPGKAVENLVSAIPGRMAVSRYAMAGCCKIGDEEEKKVARLAVYELFVSQGSAIMPPSVFSALSHPRPDVRNIVSSTKLSLRLAVSNKITELATRENEHNGTIILTSDMSPGAEIRVAYRCLDGSTTAHPLLSVLQAGNVPIVFAYDLRGMNHSEAADFGLHMADIVRAAVCDGLLGDPDGPEAKAALTALEVIGGSFVGWEHSAIENFRFPEMWWLDVIERDEIESRKKKSVFEILKSEKPVSESEKSNSESEKPVSESEKSNSESEKELRSLQSLKDRGMIGLGRYVAEVTDVLHEMRAAATETESDPSLVSKNIPDFESAADDVAPGLPSGWDKRYLGLAKHIAEWSKDPSTKVGAVLVRPDKTIASLGFNGFPRGVEDKPELLENREEKYRRVVHAEMNAILSCRDPDMTGYTLYTWPLPPCDRCAAMVIQAGVKRIVAPRQAPDRWSDAARVAHDMFSEAGVKVTYF